MALLIWDVTSAADAKNYYASSVAMGASSSRADYYSEGQESPGIFDGRLAAMLGLAGRTVDKATFDQLCDNINPATGKSLTPRTKDSRRVCKDFTFSGPKSFSIIEAFADADERRRLRLAFVEAMNETAAEDIEPDMQTRDRRNGADSDRTTGNMLTAGFLHLASRPANDNTPPDMHLHGHLLVWNATYDPEEKRIKAAQLGDIVRDKQFFRAAFYSRLAGKLEAMGYAIDRRGGMEWEIAGIPQAMIDKFSKRTEQIDAEAEKRGITDAARKATLGAEIRSKKQKELSMGELRQLWNAQLDDGDRAALVAVYRKEIAQGPAVTPEVAVEFAIAHCGEQNSVWAERELMAVALMRGLGDVSVGQITAELPRHGVIVREMNGRRMATTHELQREEGVIVGFAACGRGMVCPAGIPAGLDRMLPDGTRLNDEQWEVVTGLLASSNRVNAVEGPAGAGKSYSLQKLLEAMAMRGKTLTLLGTTTDSVGVLEKDGFKAHTAAHFLLDERMQKAARGGWVVIDEVSQLGHADAFRLVSVAKANDLKLILVGDPMQHGSVARGATMRVLKEYGGVTPFRLTQIQRQKDLDYRRAAQLLSEGKAAEGFDALDQKQWVKEIGDDAERYRAMAAEYLQSLKEGITPDDLLIVSPTHREAELITDEIRCQLREAGQLGKEERNVTRLVAVNASEAERGLASTYRVGDVIQFHQNAVGFRKGDRLTVTDPAQVPLTEAGKFQLYRPESVGLAKGDRLRFTGTVATIDGKHKLRNGTHRTVAGVTAKGITLDNGWVVPLDAGHFRRGFVETSFGAQGRTVKRVLLGMAASSLPATNREQMYVSSTRAKERLTLFTDDKDAVRKGIERSSQKLAALDLRPKPPSVSEWVLRTVAKRKRLAYDERVRSAMKAAAPKPQLERQVMGYGR